MAFNIHNNSGGQVRFNTGTVSGFVVQDQKLDNIQGNDGQTGVTWALNSGQFLNFDTNGNYIGVYSVLGEGQTLTVSTEVTND